MGRTVDQEVHAAFVEFRAKEDDKVRDLLYFSVIFQPARHLGPIHYHL
jgi:hypothetical protein